MDHDETCDILSLDGGGYLVCCGAPAVARTKTIISPLTETGHVRYCNPCHENIKAWGIETEPWPLPAGV